MAYGNQKNVNNNGPVFKGEINALNMKYWNKRLTLEFVRKLEKNEINEDQFQYDWRNPQQKITLKHEDVLKLYKIAKKVGSSDTNISRGINISSNKKNYVLLIAKKDNNISLVLEMDIDPTSKKSNGKIEYKFNNSIILSDYDGTTGSHKLENLDVEFELFEITLNEFVKSTTMAQGHSFQELNKYTDARSLTNTIKIATALNVDLGYNSNKYNKSSSVDWSAGNSIDDGDIPF